jgi:hypothetical protein
MSKTLIIGLGTGRCGSLSLSYFLNNQPGIKVLHEGAINYQAHPLKWYNDHENVLKWIKNIEKLSDSSQYFGDIGMYFLPYVDFLIEQFPRSKFICLKREREAVIQSYLKWTQDHNPWYEYNREAWRKNNIWDDAFPKFNEPNKSKAVGLYWDMYYEEIDKLIKKYPQNICCFHTQLLNDINTRSDILDFIEYHGDRNLEGEYHTHKQRTIFDKLRVNFAEFGIKLGRQILPKSVRHQLWVKFAKFFYN